MYSDGGLGSVELTIDPATAADLTSEEQVAIGAGDPRVSKVSGLGQEAFEINSIEVEAYQNGQFVAASSELGVTLAQLEELVRRVLAT